MSRTEFDTTNPGDGEPPVNYVGMAKLLDQAFVEGVGDSGRGYFRIGFMMTIMLYLHSGFCGFPIDANFLTWDPVGELVAEDLVTPDPAPVKPKRKVGGKQPQPAHA